jgi:putative endonuclease
LLRSERGALGARGEEAVAQWYRGAQFEVLDRNWRCADGELDLVACDRGRRLLAFCEVKTRTSAVYGSPLEAVTLAKQRRLRRLAARWLASRPKGAPRYEHVRFDVAAVTVKPSGGLAVVVMENAF